MADDPPTPYKASPLTITIVVTVGLAVLAAFWQLSDPRNEIKNIRETYLTVREHNEIFARITSDLKRIEDENKRQLNIDAFNVWKQERDASQAHISAMITGKADKSEVQEVWKQRRAELDDIKRQLEILRDMVLNHERDDRRLMYPPRSTAPPQANQGKP